MIASSTLYAPSFYFWFIPDFLCVKLTLLLTLCLSSSQLYWLVETTFLPLTLTSVILFLLLELSSDEVHVEEFIFPLGWIRAEVLVMCHGLAETRSDTVQDDVNELVICHLGTHIESIDIIQVFLHSTCVLEITYVVKSPVWLIVVAIVFPNGVLDFFLRIEPMLVRLPPFQRISLGT